MSVSIQVAGRNLTQREINRKIYLNTMRSVYPNSIKIVTVNQDKQVADQFLPKSIKDKCKLLDDKIWQSLTAKLHNIIVNHQRVVSRNMTRLWLSMILCYGIMLFVGLYPGLNANSSNNQNPSETLFQSSAIYQIAFASVVIISMLVMPNLVYNFFCLKPFLRQFETWKRECISAFDKNGIEVVKITSSELLSFARFSGCFAYAYNFSMLIWYGSLIWLNYERVQVEIFWRAVKSGVKVRRYSLMAAPANRQVAETAAVPVQDNQSVRKNSVRATPQITNVQE
ncbi:hypothetical protein MP228_001098 [Amoeboaphelidium protococcarum]|nr:hypothetical protein MP228_001098 [Amoeboaphelidium protococcarum]